MKIKVIQHRYEKLPRWYYGLSYSDELETVRIFHLIPLNLLIRLAMTISHVWNRWRAKPTWIDLQIRRSVAAITAAQTSSPDTLAEEISQRILDRLPEMIRQELERSYALKTP